jgi:hypothetical protein
MKTQGEKSNHSTAIQQKAAPTSFFRKAGEESFFNAKEPPSYFTSHPVQPKLSVSSPDDPQEKEADAMAEKVMRSPDPTVMPAAAAPADDEKRIDKKDEEEKREHRDAVALKVQRKQQAEKLSAKPYGVLHRFTTDSSFQNNESETADETIDRKHISLHPSDVVQRSGRGPPASSPRFESNLASSKGGGNALPESTQDYMGSRFGADFSSVRIHTGPAAEDMSSTIHAQAFTHGNDIYFNSGKYSPESTDGGLLLAHELTHTIQQGASPAIVPSVQRKCSACESEQEPERGPPVSANRKEIIQRSVVDDALGFAGSITDCISLSLDTAISCAKNKAQQVALHIPGYRALRVVLGEDPITGQQIERNGHNFIEAAFDIMPGGLLIHRKLNELHQLDAAAAFIDRQIAVVQSLVNGLFSAIRGFWNELGITDLSSPLDVIRRGANIVLGFISRVIDFAVNAATELVRMIKDWLLNQIVEFIRTQTPVYPLLTVILVRDPVTGQDVPRNGQNILNALLELGGEQGRQQRAQMQETGTWARVVGFIDEGIAIFGGAYEQIVQGFHNIWDRVSIESLMDPAGTFRMIYNEFAAPVGRVLEFVGRVGAIILQFIKEVLMRRLSAWARTVRGFHLVTVIIGRDPFTNEIVPRSMVNIIRGFMGLMEGGEEQFQQLQQSGAIERTTARINAAIARLNMTPSMVVQLFIDLWNSFSLNDLAHPIAAFQRIIDRFGEPIGRLIAFVVEIVKIVIEVILAVMNFPTDLIRNIITKAMQAFDLIKRDPVGFLKNLLRALKQGFIQFFNNIGTHLINGLTGWLMAEMRDANVRPPTDFSLRGIIGWTLELLGISMEAIWQKLAAHPRIGPQRVARIRSMINTLEGIWTFIRDVQERGIAAIWERIQSQLSRLWDIILDAVKNWVMERIITTMTTRLLSMLDPTGIMAVINSAIAIYRAIQSFIRYLRQMLEVVNSFVEGTLAIAEGNVAPAANYLENTMDRAMPIVIGFLANQVGLSGLGRRIGDMIGRARELVDQALTWLVNRAVDTAMGLLDRLMAMGRNVVAAIRNALGLTRSFRTQDQQDHSVSIADNGSIMVASAPKTIQTLVAERRTQLAQENAATPSKVSENAPKLVALTRIEALKTTIDGLIPQYNASVDGNRTRADQIREVINGHMNEIVEKLIITGIGVEGSNNIETRVIHNELSENRAQHVVAEPLTNIPGNSTGSQPHEDTPGKPYVTPSVWTSNWVGAHLLNHHLHGPGVAWNMVSGTKETNNNMKTEVENTAKREVVANPGKQYFYDVTVTYYQEQAAKPFMKYFPFQINLQWGELLGERGSWTRGPARGRLFTQDQPDMTNTVLPSFNESSAGRLYAAARSASVSISEEVFSNIVAARRLIASQSFGNDISDLISQMETYYSTRGLAAPNVFTTRYGPGLRTLAANHVFMNY